MESVNIIEIFESKNIPTDKPGFYNHPNFIAEESKNPQFLELYARYVEDLRFSREYVARGNVLIPDICEGLYQELKNDGRKGACVDIAQVISKILEKAGFWTYMVKGSCTISYPREANLRDHYFWSIDDVPFSAAHSWIVAPPYKIIDLSIALQPFSNNEEGYLPEYIITESQIEATVDSIDLINPEIVPTGFTIETFKRAYLDSQPHLEKYLADFPANLYKHKETSIKYIPCAASLSDGELEDNKAITFSGLSAIDMFNKKIRNLIPDYEWQE